MSRFFYYDFETVSVGVGLKWDLVFTRERIHFIFTGENTCDSLAMNA